jgi:hypothetical protein
MMKYTPRVRRLIAPITSAANAATPIASGHAVQAESSPWLAAIATTYAPVPKKAAWPKLTIPPNPTSRLRLVAASA